MTSATSPAEQPPATTYAQLREAVVQAAANFGVEMADPAAPINNFSWHGAQAGGYVSAGEYTNDGEGLRLHVSVVLPGRLVCAYLAPDFGKALPERPDSFGFHINPNPGPLARQVLVSARIREDRIPSPKIYTYGNALDLFRGVGTEIGERRSMWRTAAGYLALFKVDETLAMRARNGYPFTPR
ncbi:MAG TPA: hypothetical protein VLF71_06225 [Candidatus Saccharimonadales bacterium]|nr:hypothetical protein [Candidatus Saccharimonadales bacterium]